MTKLQEDLDETKIILVRLYSICSLVHINLTFYAIFFFLQHDTIEKVLQRGEKLDDLVEKSEELGLQSKTFYKTVGRSLNPTPATCMLPYCSVTQPSH